MSVRRRLRDDLVAALREGDRTEVSMLRTLIAALENAEAVEPGDSADVHPVFRPDQPRHELTDDDIRRILESERAEAAESAAQYRDLGIEDEAAELELRVQIADRYLRELP